MITEDEVEKLAIQRIQDTDWHQKNGNAISPDGIAPERDDFQMVVLEGRLAEAVRLSI